MRVFGSCSWLLTGFAATQLLQPSCSGAVASASVAPGDLTLLASLQDAREGDLRCEQDVQWQEIKGRLFFFLQRIAETHRLDTSRSVNLLTRGVSPKDLGRCPVGAAAVQLFLQLALALADPQAALEVLTSEPWPEVQDEPWQDLSLVPWSAILASRWPVFETLALLRGLLLGSVEPAAGPCEELWAQLPVERQADFEKPADVGRVARAGLDLPPSACAPARATSILALLDASIPCDSSGTEEQLLRHAQEEATPRWPLELLRTAWPALPLLAAAERRAIPEALRRGLVGELRGAVVYLHFQPQDMSRFHDIEKSIESIDRYWLRVLPERWPILVFADAASSAVQSVALRQRFPQLDLQVVVIDEQDLTWPVFHNHSFCSPGYRRAARLTAGPLYLHKALDEFTHILVVDTEFELTHAVPWDPLRNLYDQRSQLAYWQTHYERTWNRTMYLTEISREFMRQRGLQPQVPELVQYWWDYEEGHGGTFPVNIYGCIFAGAMRFFRSELFQNYFRELDKWPGWDEHCWSPQSVLAIAAGFFLNDNELTELWVFGRHQNSTKTPEEGWNLSRKGVLPADQVGRMLDMERLTISAGDRKVHTEGEVELGVPGDK